MTVSNVSELLTIRIPSKTKGKNDKTGQTYFIISNARAELKSFRVFRVFRG